MKLAAYLATCPSECHDWLSLTDLMRLAHDAFQRAKKDCRSPKGQPFMDKGQPWSDPAAFTETLTQLLVLHVQAQAHAAGIPGNEYAPAQLALWYGQNAASDDNAQTLGAGRSPADMGHGWPALLAGGPGCEVSQDVQDPCTKTAVRSSKENPN